MKQLFFRRTICMLVFAFMMVNNGFGQDVFKEMLLYQGNPPNTTQVVAEVKGYDPLVDSLVSKVSVPTLSVFLPAHIKKNAPAVIICPGGGYHTQLIEREGRKVARAFNEKGVAAFVLKYRLPDENYLAKKYIVPLMDAQQAILLVRQHAAEWGIDTAAVGIMGFSAGGHLAATAGTHYDTVFTSNNNRVNLRPDFMILINPVISFSDTIGHLGSRNNLLGTSQPEVLKQFFSAEKNVTERTPPAFLAHTADDTVVPLANSLQFFNALKKHKVAAEIHIYAAGDHGFLNDTPAFSQWFGSCIYWMQSTGWLK